MEIRLMRGTVLVAAAASICITILRVSMSAQAPELIVPEYLAAKYTAAADAPSMVTVAGQDEPGDG